MTTCVDCRPPSEAKWNEKPCTWRLGLRLMAFAVQSSQAMTRWPPIIAKRSCISMSVLVYTGSRRRLNRNVISGPV